MGRPADSLSRIAGVRLGLALHDIQNGGVKRKGDFDTVRTILSFSDFQRQTADLSRVDTTRKNACSHDTLAKSGHHQEDCMLARHSSNVMNFQQLQSSIKEVKLTFLEQKMKCAARELLKIDKPEER
jgi:hypothetical protein